MSEDQIRKIGLFFLFSLMDEKVALQAAGKTVSHLKARFSAAHHQGTVPSVELIKALRRFNDQHRKLLPRNRSVATPITAWEFVENVDASLWQRFQKDANEQEIVAIVLSLILGYTDHEIAAGLNISPGTARYRIGKGARALGLTRGFPSEGSVKA